MIIHWIVETVELSLVDEVLLDWVCAVSVAELEPSLVVTVDLAKELLVPEEPPGPLELAGGLPVSEDHPWLVDPS